MDKQKSLAQLISKAENEQIHVSQKVIKLWDEKKAAAELWLGVLQDANRSVPELDADGVARRSEFYRIARDAWEVALINTLTKLSAEIIGPYTLGVASMTMSANTADLV